MYTWTNYTNSNVAGGMFNTEANTVALCEAACVAQSNCTGIDFDNKTICWIITSSVAGQIKAATGGVNHFDLARNCQCN